MNKKEVTRDYKFADSNLVGLCKETHLSISRDATEFALYGVTAADNAAFRSETAAFAGFESDLELEGTQIEMTGLKDKAAESVRVAIREIMSRAQNKYGVGSGRYKKFGVDGMSQMDDDALLACAKRVKRVASLFQTDLATKGLTLAMLADLDSLILSFDTAMDNQHDAITDRDIITEDRIEMGNALYKKLVEYCESGKTIWVTRDEAKYNDYVIYNTPDAMPPVVPPVV